MREIKFRAWGKQINYDAPRRPNGLADWVVYMCYNPNIYNGYNSDEAADINEGIASEQEKGVILMQYTGLKDKNGKEIYEGDLINSFQNDYQPTEVYWDESLATYCTQNYHSTLSLRDSMNLETEVVGNIYENPELLK